MGETIIHGEWLMLVRGYGVIGAPVSLKGTEKKRKNYNYRAINTNVVVRTVTSPDLARIISFAGQKIKEAIEKPLTLIYMADTHKSFDMMPKIKSAVDHYKAKTANPLVIHAGDYAMGSNGIGEQINLLNKIGIQLATLGNHEFFSGPETLTKELNKSEFQTILSNLEVPKTNPISKLYDNKKIVKSLVKEIDGKKYGFIGAVTSSINGSSYSDHTGGAKTIDTVNTLKEEVNKLEQQGINRIILISHLGYLMDKTVAEKVPGIDAIVGGHSHIALPGIKHKENLIESPRNEPVLILHAGAYGEGIGVSHLIFNNKGILEIGHQKSQIETNFKNFITKIISLLKIKTSNNLNKTKNILVEVDSFPENNVISEIVNKYKSKMSKIVAISKPLDGEWPIWGESQVGGLTADAVRMVTGAHASIVQPGAIRQGLKEGIIYAEDIKDQILPFDTHLVKVKIQGREILKALNKGASCAGRQMKPGLLQVSGIKYTIDMKKDSTIRVINVMIFNGKEYEVLDPYKNYEIAYDKYLHTGGDNLPFLAKGKIIEEFTGETYSSALIKYITNTVDNNQPLHQDFSDRIIIKNRPKLSFLINFLNRLGINIKSRIEKFVFKNQQDLL